MTTGSDGQAVFVLQKHRLQYSLNKYFESTILEETCIPMWSNYVWYFSIRGDKNYSIAIPTERIIDLLKSKDLFLQIGPQTFKEKPGLPSLNLTCIYTLDGNFGTPESLKSEKCTLIDVQATKNIPGSFDYFKNILSKIACELSWELILEEDDDDNENVILYSPST